MAQSPPPTSGTPSPPASTPPAPANRGRRTWAWLFGLLPIALVVGVIAGYLAWGPDDPTRADPNGSGSDPTASPAPLTLQIGRDYYVFVKTIELYPRQPGNKTWDKLDKSAPDIRYSLTWNGHTGYTSDTRENTLIGLWDPITIDVAEALPMLGEGKLELRSTLNQGAIINATDDQTLTIDVWDEDPTGLGKDEAGQVVINVADLLQGDQTLTFEETETNAIKRIVIGTTDTAQPLQSLIEALSSPNSP
ncbi:hypothetical protein [Algisphaera agarilytica]|uniref:Uncharacterized protein n=1 Tax=Algisphaera agarilytica TaxID=1385975 RepID=A0A7X0LJZ0_9BACT|nr:hypothetical protein [Algisphaera agarilytica]MBB6429885.1 hypothetical protein [Algisphaera agarilytica]